MNENFSTSFIYQKKGKFAKHVRDAPDTSQATPDGENGFIRWKDLRSESNAPSESIYGQTSPKEFSSQSNSSTASDSFQADDTTEARSSSANRPRSIVRRLLFRRPGRPWDNFMGLFDRLHPPRRDRPNSWVNPLRLLKACTEPNPPDVEKRRVTMMVPRALVSMSLRDPEMTIEDWAEQHQCRVDLLDNEDPRTSHQPMMVVGTKKGIEDLRCSLIQALPKALHNGDTSQVFILVREDRDVRFMSPIPVVHPRKSYPYQRADQIPQPSVWTMATFAEYIDQLCQRGMPRMTHRVLYVKPEEHCQEVMKILHELLQDSAVRPAITLPAFHDILRFLIHHQQHCTVRVMMAYADDMGLALDATTFNISLQGLRATRNIQPFASILRDMLDHGLKPTGETWVAFLMCVDSVEVKQYCIGMMRRLGFLDHPPTLEDAVGQVVPDALAQWLDQGRSLEDFLQYMDHELGPLWLSTSAANKMLREVGRRGWIGECLGIWDVLRDRGVTFDIVSFNTLLSRCTAGSFAGYAFQVLDRAVQVVKFGERHQIPRDAVSYQILMRMARNCRLYNTCRVIWRYACMEGMVRFPMQVRVHDSLGTNTSRAGNPALDLWEKTSGKVIVGIPYPDKEFHSGWTSTGDEQEVVAQTRKIMTELCQWTYFPDDRLPQKDLAKGMLERDLEAWHWVRPVRPFVEMVEEALDLDYQWMEQEKTSGELMSGIWRIEHAIDVPVMARERYLAIHPPSSPYAGEGRQKQPKGEEASTTTTTSLYDTDIE
ncbi:MAG: hypothetical protein M1823_001020 [Watsoniomyces obsoletus]|nr:MAG: hypothetical protein M1823_001020 [Watsoniomyces obsoletus]